MWTPDDDMVFVRQYWHEILRSQKDLGESEGVGTPGRARAEWSHFRAVAK